MLNQSTLKKNLGYVKTLIDATAWLALADNANPDHARVAEIINSVQASRTGITCDYFLRQAAIQSHDSKYATVLNQLTWHIRTENAIDIIRIDPEDEDNAWELFYYSPLEGLKYSHCLLAVLFIKYQTQYIIHANKILEDHLPILIQRASHLHL